MYEYAHNQKLFKINIAHYITKVTICQHLFCVIFKFFSRTLLHLCIMPEAGRIVSHAIIFVKRFLKKYLLIFILVY